MSKKTFAAAPRPKPPTDNQIDAYVSGGAGHDTAPANQSAHEKGPTGPMKRLSLDLPEDTHRRFKVACAATGKKMKDELVALIEARTAALETELKS